MQIPDHLDDPGMSLTGAEVGDLPVVREHGPFGFQESVLRGQDVDVLAVLLSKAKRVLEEVASVQLMRWDGLLYLRFFSRAPYESYQS